MVDESFDYRVKILVAEDGDKEDLDLAVRQLRTELEDLGIEDINYSTEEPLTGGEKGVDPLLVGALVVAIVPTLLEKSLVFLHDWAMRRENRNVEISIQSSDGSSVQLKVPSSMSKNDVKNWIEIVSTSLPKKRNKNKK